MAWNTSTSFPALIELNKKFLQGEISSSPYWCGPIEDETSLLVPALLKLHDRQIFTFSSQPYARERTRGQGGKLYDHWQRAFISFIVSVENNPNRLFQVLRATKDIKVHARRVYSLGAALSGSFTKAKVVTKYRRSSPLRRWKEATSIDPVAEISEEDLYRLEAMKQAQPWEFQVVAASWKDIDVARLLLTAVEEAQA